MDMIISVVPKKQQLDHLLPAALALIGAGILKFFIDPDGKKLPVRAGAVEARSHAIFRRVAMRKPALSSPVSKFLPTPGPHTIQEKMMS